MATYTGNSIEYRQNGTKEGWPQLLNRGDRSIQVARHNVSSSRNSGL